MGVKNIFPFLLPDIGQTIKLSGFKPQKHSNTRKVRIAIDVSTWIAQACHGHGATLIDERKLTNYGRSELIHERETTTTTTTKRSKCVDNERNELETTFVSQCCSFVITSVLKLRDESNGDIIVILDGNTPPIKINQCRKRKMRRDEALRVRDRDVDEWEEGCEADHLRAARRAGAADKLLHEAVVLSLMRSLRSYRISFLVSPYEADGQLAFLSKRGYVDLVVTEDSDMIAYGAKAILFKLDKRNCRDGQLIKRCDLGSSINPCFLDFSDAMIAVVFVASGCDYCDSLKGIGIKTATVVVKKAFHESSFTNKPALYEVLQGLFSKSRGKTSKQDRAAYEHNFLSALLIYRHAIVFDPTIGKCIFSDNKDPELETYPPYADLCSNRDKMEAVVGQLYNRDKAIAVAEGWLNPKSNKFYDETNTPSEIISSLPNCDNNTCFQKTRRRVVNVDPQNDTVRRKRTRRDYNYGDTTMLSSSPQIATVCSSSNKNEKSERHQQPVAASEMKSSQNSNSSSNTKLSQQTVHSVDLLMSPVDRALDYLV